MNKRIFIIGGIVLGIILLVVIVRFGTPEDTWICQDGQWVKHGNPSSPMPDTACPGSQPPQAEPDIVVTNPAPDEVIKSPLVMEGKAKGNWFFEASAPVKLLDNKGNGIAVSYIQAIGDWMTTEYVPFQGQLSFSYNATTSGTLVFQNDNPSGLPENAKEFWVPVKLVPIVTIKVKAFFNNDKMDPEFSCNKVFPVEREIPKTQAVARAALEELLKGPTDNEKIQGFLTNINPGVKIQSLVITNGVAKVDFDEQLEFQVGGSCRVAAIRAQITETLKQFPTVKSIIISINGRTEDILQP